MKFSSQIYILFINFAFIFNCISGDITFETTCDEKSKTTTLTMFDVKKRIGNIKTTKSDIFSIFKSPEILSLDKSTFPSDIVEIIILMETLDKENLEKTEIMGDLYIEPEYRGQGNAKKIIEHACKTLFEKEINKIILIPHPFKYENGVQKSLVNTPNFESDKKKLIKLYENFGFKLIKYKNLDYMVKTSH